PREHPAAPPVAAPCGCAGSRRRPARAGGAGRPAGHATALTCAGLLFGKGGHMTADSSMARSAQILRFVLKHRRAGLFGWPGTDPAAAALAPDPDAVGGAEAVVTDLEALGPTFIKAGQSL